jgi:hypothetical protein
MIKKTAVDAVNASKPANMVFGKVISTSPLKIKIDQKLILTSAQLVLSKSVTNYRLSVTLDGNSKTMTVNNALKNGEEVILMQVSGGQKYIVIDKI